MRFVAILIASLALCACTTWKEPRHATWKNTTSVEAMEQLYWQAVKDKDWAAVEAHTASNYSYMAPSGVSDKAKILETYKKLDRLEFSLGDFQVTDHGETTVVTYTAVASYVYEGKALGPTKFRNMTVWQKQKSGWQMIAGAVFPIESLPLHQ
jgi:ketosteroid isomerase-like protein